MSLILLPTTIVRVVAIVFRSRLVRTSWITKFYRLFSAFDLARGHILAVRNDADTKQGGSYRGNATSQNSHVYSVRADDNGEAGDGGCCMGVQCSQIIYE